MSHTPGSLKPIYESPQLCAFASDPDALLCDSHVSGTNEEYTYEDWNQYIQQD